MAQKMNKDQMLVRISMVNGVPTVTPLSAEEEQRFFKTHPNANVPTFSPADVSKGLTMLEAMLPRPANPSAK